MVPLPEVDYETSCAILNSVVVLTTTVVDQPAESHSSQDESYHGEHRSGMTSCPTRRRIWRRRRTDATLATCCFIDSSESRNAPRSCTTSVVLTLISSVSMCDPLTVACWWKNGTRTRSLQFCQRIVAVVALYTAVLNFRRTIFELLAYVSGAINLCTGD